MQHFGNMNYLVLRNLFHAYVLQPWNTVESFSMSDDQRVLNDAAGQSYPQLQVDPPSYSPTVISGRTGRKTYRTTAAIVTAQPVDDYTEQDRSMDALEVEMDKLIGWIDQKRKVLTDKVRIESVGEVFPITYNEHANLVGWAVPIEISTEQAYCVDLDTTYAVSWLYPVNTAGEDTLRLGIDSATYEIQWAYKSGASAVLPTLAAQINQGGHDLTAEVHRDTLMLRGNTVNTSLQYTTGLDGHAWETFDL